MDILRHGDARPSASLLTSIGLSGLVAKMLRVWRQLTNPPAAVTHAGRAHQIRLLTGMLLLLIPLSIACLSIQLALAPDFEPAVAVSALVIVFLIVAYALARTGHYRSSATLAVGVTAVGCLATLAARPYIELSYAYLFLSVFLASLLFNKTGAAIATLLLLLLVILVLPALGIGPASRESITLPIFLTLASALLLLYRWHRDTLEQERYRQFTAREVRFRRLADASFEGIVVSQDNRVVDMNERATIILGAPREAILGRSVLDFYAPGSRANFVQHLHANSEAEYEIIGQRADGTPFPQTVHNRLSAHLGQPACITVFRDISEHRFAEDVLPQISPDVSTAIGEPFFHSLVAWLAKTLDADYVFVGEWASGARDRIRTIAVQSDGHPAANVEYPLAGTPCEYATHHQACACPQAAQAQFPADHRLATQAIEAYVGVALYESNQQPLGLVAVLFRRSIEQDQYILAILQSVATRATAELKRVHAERVLHAHEARYRSIVETMREGIWQIDPENRTIFVNPTMAGMLGYTAAEMLGQTLFTFMQDTDKTSATHRIELSFQDGMEQHDFKFRHKNGGQIDTRANMISLTNEHHQRIGTLLMLADITQPTQAEQQILQLKRLLLTTSGINQLMARGRSRQELLSTSCRVLVEHGEYRMAWVGMANYATGVVQPVASAGFDEQYLTNLAIRCDNTPLGQGPTGTAIREGRTVINPDAQLNERYAPWKELARHYGYYSSAAIPLRVAGQVIGAINVYSAVSGAFNQNEIALLEDLVEDIGFALDGQEEMDARKRAEEALAKSEANFRSLAENSNVGILVSHRDKHVFANNHLLKMLGYTLDELREIETKALVHPNNYDTIMNRFHERSLRGDIEGKSATPMYEILLLTKRGKKVPVEISATKTTWQGESAGLVFLLDISDRQRTEAQMHKLSRAIEQTADAVTITDCNGVIEYVNPAFEHMTGFTQAEAVGQKPHLVKSGKQGAAFYEKLWETILAGQVFSEVFINRHKNGNLYYEEKTITPLKDSSGDVTHFVATGKDVTERMQTQERLQYMAQHDALTELPNRVLLLDRLKQALARARWHTRIVALLFVDLDRFKTINDTLGHETGDMLLQQLATRFSNSVRTGDTVARFGGDEFVILLDDVANENDIRSVALKVLGALTPAFEIGSQHLYITASIGISLFPNDGEDSTTLLKNADVAMYRAKELGKNTYQFYSADMSARAFERLTLESSLRHALERNELRLHYQPVFDVESSRIIGVEALLRWQHPDFGLVLPNDFIPLLEETGLIIPAGQWVLDTACAQLRAWHAAGWPQLRMAINLSPRQFQVGGQLTNTLDRNLKALCCNPHLLELEITEGLLLQHAASTQAMLDRMQTMGLRLAIDDFGTGYSSLSYLRRFPIDTLKIDRSFVHDIPGDEDDSAITTAIIVLAQSLKLDVIAEGVETVAQRDFLHARGCHLMQGFLFSQPLAAAEVTRLLETQNTLSRSGMKKLY